MSATEALDAYLERQQSSKKASSSAKAAVKPQEPPRAAATPPARLPTQETGSRLRNMAKVTLPKPGAPRADDRAKEGAIKAVWPPSPLNEKDERPLLAKSHPATARMAQPKRSETAPGDQAGALTKLKKLSSSRLRNASGTLPRAQAGSEAAQPDHFAAALEKLRRDQQAGQQSALSQGAARHAAAGPAGEGSQESPGQQRRARWDPLADTEDRLALQRLTQKAAALSAQPSPTKGRRSNESSEQLEGAIRMTRQLRLGLSAAPTPPEKRHSSAEDSAQAREAKESAQILDEVLSELRAAEERFTEQHGTSIRRSSLTQAAHHEASALGAVAAWYRDVQRKHAAAGLGDDPIIASILPGSSRKLRQPDAPPDKGTQAEPTEGSEDGPLLQAMMASLPKVPEMPKKAPANLPVMQREAASPQQQGQGDSPQAAAPVADFAAKLSGLAEDMPRLQRDTFLRGDGQGNEPASPLASPQPQMDARHPSIPHEQDVKPQGMPAQSPPLTSATIVVPVVAPKAPQHIPSSVGRDLALLQQRWQGYHEPPLAKPDPDLDGSVPHGGTLPHWLPEEAPSQPQSVGQQQQSSSLLHDELSGPVSGVPAQPRMAFSASAQAAGVRAQPNLQGRPTSVDDRAAPELSPLSALSPVIGTPVEYYTYSAPPAAGAVPEPLWEATGGSGFLYHAGISPGEHKLGNPLSDMPQAPLSHSSIRQLWGHPEHKERGREPWADGPGGLGPAWAAQDRAASAMLESRLRGSPAHSSEVDLAGHSAASDLMGFHSATAKGLTEASDSLMAPPQFCGSPSHGSLLQHGGSSMSVSSGSSQGARENPFSAPLETSNSVGCASTAPHRAGALDALLADALSQDADEMYDMHLLPGDLGVLSHEQHAGASGRLLHEGVAELIGFQPAGAAVSRPGSSRASLVGHYIQRGRVAHRAASSGARQSHAPVALWYPD